MGNAKSRNNFHKIEKENSRNLTQPQLTTTNTTTTRRIASTLSITREEDNKVGGTTTTTNTIANTTVGGPLLVEVRNKKTITATTTTTTAATTKKYNKAIEDPQQIHHQHHHNHHHQQRQQKAADNSVNNNVAEQQQQQHQRFKQASLWSLGSLNWNLSFSGRNSYKQRQKSSRKSFSTLQYQRNKRSKTQWHKPLTNAIFSSHFKESSRNEEFHIDQLVAKGAFGVVFKVIDKKYIKEQQQQQKQQQQQPQFITDDNLTATPVYALKVLKKSKIISENSLQQIKDEADIQKLCGHNPFIVKQFDLWQNRHNLHILSEYIPNGELFSTIGSFSLNLIRLYLAEIALALDFLHNAGIIYRDAKPENILLTSNYHIKLTDFGLSKWLKFGLTTKTMCGTFQYMAPEILRGDPYSHAVDWWSLGIIVCQMFIKKSPDIRQFIVINLPKHLQPKDSVDNMPATALSNNFQQSELSPTETKLQDLANFLPEEVKTLPHEARDVLQRLLEFDAQKRIHSVRSLQRIAMYMHFKIESEYCLKICPLDIITNDNITLYNNQESLENSHYATKAFRDF